MSQSLSPGLQIFRLGYELSPIILTGGLATYIPGGMLPIVALTQAVSFLNGILSGAQGLTSVDDFFARFRVGAGATLIDNEYGQYPFANQKIAANAVIANPLAVSLIMFCPARGAGSMAAKLATMEALAAALKQHSQLGGLYTVVTPTKVSQNCVLDRLLDVTSSDSKQPQSVWQWDFHQPLVTENEAEAAQQGLIASLTGGTFTTGSLSGLTSSLDGVVSTTTTSIITTAKNLLGVV